MKKVILIAVLSLLGIALHGSDQKNRVKIKGNNNIVKQEFSITDYTDILLEGMGNHAYTVIYSQDEHKAPYMQIEIDQNLLEYISISSNGHQLRIGVKDSKLSLDSKKIVIHTNSKDLKDITIKGVAKFVANEKVNLDNINLALYGVGDISFDKLEADFVKCSLPGVGSINLAGKVNKSDMKLEGVGNINALGLEQGESNCRLSGVGDISVLVNSKLSANCSGVGSVKYKGNAQVTGSKSNFLSKVTQIK